MEQTIMSSEQIQITSDRRIYTVEEVADILGIGRSSAYNLVKEELFKTQYALELPYEYQRNPLTSG